MIQGTILIGVYAMHERVQLFSENFLWAVVRPKFVFAKVMIYMPVMGSPI